MQFNDMNGTIREGKLTLAVCEALKEKAGIDLLALSLGSEGEIDQSMQQLASFFNSPARVIRAVQEICRPADPQEFLGAIDAEVFARAREALRDELLGFFPDGTKSGVLQFLRKSGECQKQILERTVALLDPATLAQMLTPENMQQMLREKGEALLRG